MTWDVVIQKLVALLTADPTLVSLLGGPYIYRNTSRTEITTPGVFYTIVSNTPLENEAPVIVQWDIWTYGVAQMASVEKRLYELMHRDLPVEVDGLPMWSQMQDSYDFDEDENGLVHRAVEYRYTTARVNG